MPTIQTEKPRQSNVTIKLEASATERLRSLAIARNRTPHFLMKEAINTYIEREEIEQRFIAKAVASRESFKKTGLHTTHEEFSRWVDTLQDNIKATPPVCHK